MFRIGDIIRCITPVPEFTVSACYTVIAFQNCGDSAEWNSVVGDNGRLYLANHKDIAPLFEQIGIAGFSHRTELMPNITCDCGGFKTYQTMAMEAHSNWCSSINNAKVS